MVENNKQRTQQGSTGNQESSRENQRNDQNRTKQNSGSRREVSSEQSSRLESQPGNMSGVDTESQRSRSGNQDLGARGSNRQSTESF